jgi:hypothetical protein
MKKGNYPPSKSIICYDNHSGAVELMGAVHCRKVIWAGPFLQGRLFGVLSAFNALLKSVFKTVPICDVDVGVRFAKVMVWPDRYIFIVGVPVDFVVRPVGESICMICGPWFVFQQDIILFPLREISRNAWPDFSGVTVISEVRMVSVHQDGDRCSF